MSVPPPLRMRDGVWDSAERKTGDPDFNKHAVPLFNLRMVQAYANLLPNYLLPRPEFVIFISVLFRLNCRPTEASTQSNTVYLSLKISGEKFQHEQ